MKLRHSGAYWTVDGIYVMIDGQPVGEYGLRWWVYKVVNAMRWRMNKKRDKVEDMPSWTDKIKLRS